MGTVRKNKQIRVVSFRKFQYKSTKFKIIDVNKIYTKGKNEKKYV